MLKLINGFKQLVDFPLLDFFCEPIWLRHINLYFKITTEKCYLDVNLPYLVIKTGNYGDKYADGFELSNKRKGFLIVNHFLLGITLFHKSSLIDFDFSIDFFLLLVDLFAPNGPNILRWVYMFSDGVGIY